MVLVKKWKIYHIFLFSQIGVENVFDDILEKKAFVDYKNKQFLIFKNWDFSRGFFCGKIGQENVFDDILGRKKAFLDYKKRSLKRRKIGIFPKGLVHGFGQKIVYFPFVFSFRHNMPGKCVSRYSKSFTKL